ncbi:MAG TPA: rhodanese-like domain-containing protein [Polyangia bacterium]
MAKQVSVAEAAELMKAGWRYVDVRSVPEFEAGHPEGAFNVPLLHLNQGRMLPNRDFLTVTERCFAREDKLLIGCKMAGRSAQAAALLEASGFTDIAFVRGGFLGERDAFGRLEVPGWLEAGLPTSGGAPEGRSYAALVQGESPAPKPTAG